ncbi:M16 family metallopeptidase [Legionella sp. W05-934-2]|jgi:zinc protease|uniref:M16 family metallopeptidase n=1 Tax=Legionella sp. W05-934-2 TaxID=1198649 RepID=UPI0034619CE7
MKRLIACFTVFFLITNIAHSLPLTAESWLTENGMKVVYYKAPQVPMVVLKMGFPAGSAQDEALFGLASVTNQLIGEESSSSDATEIAERFADVGAQFSTFADRTMAGINLKSLSKSDALLPAVDNLANLLSNFHVSEGTFKRVQQQQLVAIRASQQDANEVANMVFFQSLYGDHPYAHSVDGTLETVSALTQPQIERFFNQHYGAKGATLVLVGDLDKKTAEQLATKLSKALPQAEATYKVNKATPHKNGRLVKRAFPSSQTIIRMGQLGIDYHSPDMFPLKVGNYILGGGLLVSRLAFEVREKRGLSYGVGSQFVPMPAIGPFLISLSTKQSQADQAIQVTESVTENFIKHGPTDQELKEAKQYLVGSFPLSLASNDKIATMMLRIHFFSLPNDYLLTYRDKINEVTSEQVRQSMAKQLKPEQMLRVEVGQTSSANNA